MSGLADKFLLPCGTATLVGWDGLSFAVLFPLAVGLLAMDEFSKARGTFALTAVALAIKPIVENKRKQKRKVLLDGKPN